MAPVAARSVRGATGHIAPDREETIVKYSKVSGALHWSGGTTILSVGMSADDDHPLVVERPDLFGDEAPAPQLRSTAGNDERATRVERATRAPGEKRGGTSRG